MKKLLILTSSLIVFIMFALLGCQPAAQPTVDTAATVSAAVQATTIAQANLSATVEASTKATMTAIAQQAVAAAPTATSTKAAVLATSAAPVATVAPTTAPAKSPTPAPTVNYVTMSEEELEAYIDQAVKEATAATTSATTTTTTYAADGTLTPQEVAALMTAVSLSQEEINQAAQAVQAYYDLYGQLATETLSTLQAIEQDLNSMASSMASMSQSLTQINTTLSQGLTLAQSTITQLQATATKASQAAQSAQAKASTWSKNAQAELTKRATTALNIQPNNVPTDFKTTVQSVNTYVETLRGGLSDNKLSQKDLQAISLAGANATAGLKQFNIPQAQTLANSINTTTQQIARGEMPKAKTSLSGLDQSAKSFASLPNPPAPSGGIQPPRK